MSTPSSPLENALVLGLEAIERVLQADAPSLSFVAADVVPASGSAHTFAVTGVTDGGSGVLGIGVSGHVALTALVGAQGEALAAAIGADLSAALDRPITVSPSGQDPTDELDGTMSVQATIEGLEEAASLWVAVDEVLGATIGDLVRERLDSLEHAPAPPATGSEPPIEVMDAEFPQMGNATGGGTSQDLSLLSDVQLDISVELGRTNMRVRDLLELGTGSVVELDRSAGTPVDVLVNGTIVARGEVVVVDDELGVRVTEVVRNDAGLQP